MGSNPSRRAYSPNETGQSHEPPDLAICKDGLGGNHQSLSYLQGESILTSIKAELIIRAGRVFCDYTGLDGPGAVLVRGSEFCSRAQTLLVQPRRR